MDNGGSVFPMEKQYSSDNEGLSLRDLIAMVALYADMSRGGPKPSTPLAYAGRAYAFADAMIKVRSEDPNRTLPD